MRTSTLASICISALTAPVEFLVTACGAPADGENLTDSELEIAQVRSELNYASQVTGTGGTAGADQNETQVGFSYASQTDSIQFVAYNDKSGPALDIFGYAYNDPVHSTGWRTRNVPIPTIGGSKWKQLWGDPALINNPAASRYTYISNMAASPTSPVNPQGGYFLDGFCLATLDRQGNLDSPPVACYKTNHTAIDGQALAAGGPNGQIFLGYVADNQIDIWATPSATGTFTQLTGAWVPFPGRTMISHPRLAVDNSSGGLFVVAREQPAQGTSLLQMNFGWASGFFGVYTAGAQSLDNGANQIITIGGKQILVSSPAYSMAVGLNDSGNVVARVAYVQFMGGHYQIRYADCSTTSCFSPWTTWDTINSAPNDDSIYPSIAYGDDGSGHKKWKVAFLTTYPSHGVLQVGYQTLVGDGSQAHPYQLAPIGVVSGTDTPCPDGDYNSLAFNKSTPNFIYAYPKVNTGTTCNASPPRSTINHIYEAVVPF